MSAVRLSRQLSIVTGLDLPSWSAGPQHPDAVYEAGLAAGYEGLQVFLPDQAAAARAAGYDHVSAIAPLRTAADIDAVVGMWADAGTIEALVVHLGTGFESPGEATALVDHLVATTDDAGLPVLVETHRATLTQDPARTLVLAAEHAHLAFCADLSHWYTGVELVYGDLDAKLERLAAVLGRCRMVHGRIADPGCIQVAVAPDDPRPHVEHFRRMWATVLAGAAAAGIDELPFVVELLPASLGYARTVDRGDGPQEEVDRWAQAEVVWGIGAALAEP